MPSAATSNPYDNDAVERDLIDPDDGASHPHLPAKRDCGRG